MNRITCTVGKTFLLLVLLAATSVSKAQHCDSIPNHLAGHYCLWPLDAIQLADSSILILNTQDSLTTNNSNQEPIPYLTKFYKISRHGGSILDSITFDTYNMGFMMARLHNNADNKYSNIMIKFDEESNEISLDYFDDDLNFNDEMGVTFSIADTSAYVPIYSFLFLNSNDDIILHYYTEDSTYFARYGLDGTLKHTKAYHKDIVPNGFTDISPNWIQVDGLRQFGDNPLGYNYFGGIFSHQQGGGASWGFELDSMFNITHHYELQNSGSGFPSYATNPYFNGMLSQGDGTAYFIRNAWWEPYLWGTVIQKVNENSEVIGEARFMPCPRQYNVIKAINMEKDMEGNICYSFFGLDMDSCDYVATVKVDPDLNILWERYALRRQAPYQEFLCEPTTMKVFGDRATLVFGQTFAINYFNNPNNPTYQQWLRGLFLTLVYDEVETIGEMENAFRPYIAYPNPVHDQINLHYSPDARPARIDLYDLQGRLVRTQNKALESINLSQLPAGTYTMRVTMENGKVYSDKVVKE